ncbi:MAG: hypothetical protein AAF950_17530, partial [Pseudomonadota bacterium]
MEYSQLGEGILLVDTSSILDCPPTVTLDGVEYHRFMDRLLLPVTTDRLSQPQILTINRWREREYLSDPQFDINRSVKKELARFIGACEFSRILEFGCGIFGINQYLPSKIKYFAADMDIEAITYLKNNGIKAYHVPDEYKEIEKLEVDCIVFLFVLHFDISDDVLAVARNSIRSEGVILANMCQIEENKRVLLRDRFYRHGFCVKRLQDDEAEIKNHEYW